MPEKKLSIIIPVYFNEDTIMDLYEDIKVKVIDVLPCDVELVFVDDGSGDRSYDILKKLSSEHAGIKAFHLSRNFGSHAAILCGLSHSTGDCAVIKAADLQEPSEVILEMYEKWENGSNVVLAVREGRDDAAGTALFANFYYWFVSKVALPTMPRHGFDIYLIDRKVITVLDLMDEKNSALTGQILWSGFRTDTVYYRRLARTTGKSRWTLKKKAKLFSDSVFSFSSLPISVVTGLGIISTVGAVIWAIVTIILRLTGSITVQGWTLSFIFSLFSLGVIMLTLGLLGGYLWRTFDASRNRPLYIVEEEFVRETQEKT
jgi:dolichol-phosphate mannosyltransferase